MAYDAPGTKFSNMDSPRGTALGCPLHNTLVLEEDIDLLQYLISRTDIHILTSNIRWAIKSGKINPEFTNEIEDLFDYSLGLIKDTLSPAVIKIFCWLVLSYGGTGPWNKFEQKIEQSLQSADKAVKKSLADCPCPTELQITIINLNLYLDILLLCVDYDRHGGPTLGEEPEDVLREAREPIGRKIPTNNLEILASRLVHALELLQHVMWGDCQHLFRSVHPEACECEYPILRKAGIEADNDEPAIFPSIRPKINESKTPKAPSTEFTLQADMDKLSQTLQTALKIQEELLLQFLDNKGRLESNIKLETIQGPKPQANSEIRSKVKQAVKPEIVSELGEEVENEKMEINKRV